MSAYLAEFAPLMLVFTLAVISPGPDFALILRQACVYGRSSALFSSLGIGSAMLIHVSYTVWGLGLIIAKSLLWFNLIKWAGVAYLLYLGLKALTSKATPPSLATSESDAQPNRPSILNAYLTGFAINLLNPKAVVFFLSIFSSLVSTTTPVEIKLTYGMIITAVTALWFILVSLFITTLSIRRLFMRLSKWINRASGLVFIGFGVRLIFQKSF